MKKTLYFLAAFLLFSTTLFSQETVEFNYKATYVAEGKDTVTFHVQDKGQVVSIDPALIPMDDSQGFIADLVLLDLASEKMILRGMQAGTENSVCVSMSFDNMFPVSAEIENAEEQEVIQFKKTDMNQSFQGAEYPVYKATTEEFGEEEMEFVIDASFEYQLSNILTRAMQSDGDTTTLVIPQGLPIQIKSEGDVFLDLIKLEDASKKETYTINIEM